MKLLVELPSWLGDCVMLTPAFENLVSFYDNPEITILGSSISVEVLKNHPNVVNFFILNKSYSSFFRQLKFLDQYDVFISFRDSYRTTILKFFISAKNKYQFNKNYYLNKHVVEKYNDFVNEVLNVDKKPGRLFVYQNNVQSNNSILIAGINPGAAYGDAKRWNIDKFAEVALRLSSTYEIIIFGGPDEVDIACEIEKKLVKNNVSNFQNLAGKTTIQELINHISNLSLFVTGDSGPMHLAASFQIPTVSIFGPTLHHETSQWKNSKSTIVKKNLSCQPCMKRTCPLKHQNCMNFIEVEEVLSSIDSLN
jgi:heptosyltransferase-2